MGLFAGGLILGEGTLYGGLHKMASETTDTVRQNASLYLKNEESVSYYSSVCSFKKIVSEIVPLWLKNRNQRVHTVGLMRARWGGGGLIRGVTGVLRERWAYLQGLIMGLGGVGL